MTNDKKTKTNAKEARNRKQTGDAKIQKATSSNESGQGVQQDEVDISPYISNVDGNVYAITGLTEEFIATLFAWVSRSPKSFKEHVKEAIQQYDIQAPSQDNFAGLTEKAKKFHEKWTVGYGHSSVAEHATAHVGIESISRLASAELELSNTFLSITEYSQRYQKPERFKWTNPFDHESQKTQWMHVNNFFHNTFDVFEKLIEGIESNLNAQITGCDEDQLKRRKIANRKLAFEDARYVLPLAMHTQLGVTANGRAWRDAIAQLGNSDHKESLKLADDLHTEITKVLPVLLRYASPSQYMINSKKRMQVQLPMRSPVHMPSSDVQLNVVEDERQAINKIFSLLNLKHTNLPYQEGMSYATNYALDKEKNRVLSALLFEMQHFDMAPPEFNHIRYSVDLLASEANWHQLLRHNRKTDFTFSKPTPSYGLKIPPRIVEAGLQDLLKEIAAQSEELYNKLVDEGFMKEAEYVVLNAHKRLVHADFSLTEAYHLINLRTSEEAQWDIRETFEELYKQLSTVHPLLMSKAKRRN